MNKAFLIIDTPDRCYDCPLLKFGGPRYRCGKEIVHTMGSNQILERKPEWCPLHKIPNRIPYHEKTETNNMNLYALGWNNYRNKILGVQEENVQEMDWYDGD